MTRPTDKNKESVKDLVGLMKPVVMLSSNLGKPILPLDPEFGGPKGPEPTRFGDWETKGRCSDF